MFLTNEQIKGMLDRAAAVGAAWFLAWCVKKGWIGESDVATLLPALVLFPSLAWGWWVNRNKALLQSASNTVDANGQKPIIVTSPAVAATTPETNIVSSAEVRVVAPTGQTVPLPTTN